jgi:hypothetical protein
MCLRSGLKDNPVVSLKYTGLSRIVKNLPNWSRLQRIEKDLQREKQSGNGFQGRTTFGILVRH